MGTSFVRRFRWDLVGLAAAGLALFSVCANAAQVETVLLKVRWQDRFELSCLEGRGFALRYCQREWALFEVPAQRLEEVGSCVNRFSVVDTVRAGERYWLARGVDDSSRDSLSLYGELFRLDGERLFLVRVKEALEERLAPWVSAMALLPEKATCRGLFPRLAPPRAGVDVEAREPLGEERLRFLSSVSSQVSLDSIVAIVHFLSVDDSSGELRTRFTFRDETFQMAQLLRQRLREAMGGRGEDSLHVFVFRYGGVDYDKYNVIGRLPGIVPESGTFVLCAHYDSYAGRTAYADPDRRWNWRTEPAPGADDNGSGVASVLECARVLSELEFDFDIEFVLFCAEEQGLFGSRAYSEEHDASGSNVLGVLNFDMHAFRESADTTFVRTNVSSEWLSNHIERISAQLYDSIGVRVGLTPVENLFDASDHSSFWMDGFDAVHFFEHSSLNITNPYYHTIYDTEEKLNFELSCKVAKLAAASMAYFATTSDPWDFEVLSGDIEFRVEGTSSLTSRAAVGQTVSITPSFHNVGGSTPETLSVRVSVYDGDPSAGGWLIGQRLMSGAVPSGGSVPVTPFYWVLHEGDVGVHSIHLVVDSGDGEQNVTNNVASRTIGVESSTLTIAESFVFPNPSRSAMEATTLRFSLTRDAEEVEVDVYDISGRRVAGCRDASCGDDVSPPRLGLNEISLAEVVGNEGLASGVYFYRVRVVGEGESRAHFGRFALVR